MGNQLSFEMGRHSIGFGKSRHWNSAPSHSCEGRKTGQCPSRVTETWKPDNGNEFFSVKFADEPKKRRRAPIQSGGDRRTKTGERKSKA
jgi:hypothetical protein